MDNNHQNLTGTMAILNYQRVNHSKTFQSPLAEGHLPEFNFQVDINCLLVLATAIPSQQAPPVKLSMKLGENGDQIQQAPVGILSSETSTKPVILEVPGLVMTVT